MRPLEYLTPHSLAEALERLAGSDPSETVVWGGGTALGPLLRRGLVRPRVLLGLERVAGLQDLSLAEDGLRVGALVRLADLSRSPVVRGSLPLLAEAAGRVGNVRVRNAATLGGHLAHADPAQDLPPVLLALDAQVRLESVRGTRTLPLERFLVGPLQTARADDELLTEVWVPAAAFGRRTAYVRFTPRSSQDYPTVGVAASLRVDADGVCREARVAVGGAAPTALRVPAAEAALVGGRLTRERCRDAAAQVESAVDPWDDTRGSARYKRAMARVWTERVLEDLASEA
ncbi:MAG: xanthine dehydrogenase family protein subunit M [Armatimonadota bacterium]|nr:xanthine dehydrogenase family protein subunit M [Armatimonadota bacterium]MDR5677042.1 xanthine dehydrogenase family protein subunit M [Armatimonadota bacterium]MDR5689800.1 xanthine dehydrogenase family protein subunit M [Armatimonadota bacterium]MDR7445961.1 xanthine dehydrogenase family protein subunit M [Armatimonadota bacterium]MDR7476472.1 xanthine dehydrogenase family protein subunit M [Armatimonadota bacterium]